MSAAEIKGSEKKDVEFDTEEELAEELEEQHAKARLSREVREGSISPEDVLECNEILNRKCVTIVVLGDIGRSPRMRYHALSLAQEYCYVHFIGYRESAIPKDLEENDFISLSFMQQPPKFLQTIPRLIAYPLKIAWMLLTLSLAFFWMIVGYQFRPDYILVQNPPAIPVLALCWAYSRCLWSTFIIDWHNYGYSIMAITLGEKNPMVRFAKWFEDYFGAKADKHLCVTRAMKDDLKKRLNIDAVTLYDRPPDNFRSFNAEEKTEFLSKFAKDYPSLLEVTESVNNPPGIIVSSTSWTEDEDFSILLRALQDYESTAVNNTELYPKLIVFITGKGPLKEYYRKQISMQNLTKVEIYLPWLEHEDYPKLLASSDLGICLHYSSSGLDLPMKVVDMFGSGLPVCAVDFNCISELVKHDENGLVFKDSTELAQQIQNWFKITSKSNPNHSKFRKNIKAFQSIQWHENWKFHAQPLFTTEE